MLRGAALLPIAVVAALSGCIAGCITSYDVLPLCGARTEAAGSGTLMRGSLPTSDCRVSAEVEQYEWRLVSEILRRSQWQFPMGIPLRVELDADRRVELVCLGAADAQASWSTRDRVASSLRSLYAAPPGPACLAGTTLDLTAALTVGSAQELGRFPYNMISCDGYRDRSCVSRQTVCAVFRDGRRRTYADACRACSDSQIVGFVDFRCRP